jgi:hypothetical protein
MTTQSEKRYTQSQVDVKLITEKLNSIEKKVEVIDAKLSADYVTKDQHKLLETHVLILQKIVYGVVALILTGVIGGFINFYINSPK